MYKQILVSCPTNIYQESTVDDIILQVAMDTENGSVKGHYYRVCRYEIKAVGKYMKMMI